MLASLWQLVVVEECAAPPCFYFRGPKKSANHTQISRAGIGCNHKFPDSTDHQMSRILRTCSDADVINLTNFISIHALICLTKGDADAWETEACILILEVDVDRYGIPSIHIFCKLFDLRPGICPNLMKDKLPGRSYENQISSSNVHFEIQFTCDTYNPNTQTWTRCASLRTCLY